MYHTNSGVVISFAVISSGLLDERFIFKDEIRGTKGYKINKNCIKKNSLIKKVK